MLVERPFFYVALRAPLDHYEVSVAFQQIANTLQSLNIAHAAGAAYYGAWPTPLASARGVAMSQIPALTAVEVDNGVGVDVAAKTITALRRGQYHVHMLVEAEVVVARGYTVAIRKNGAATYLRAQLSAANATHTVWSFIASGVLALDTDDVIDLGGLATAAVSTFNVTAAALAVTQVA